MAHFADPGYGCHQCQAVVIRHVYVLWIQNLIQKLYEYMNDM